jgi:hypothetical protein
MSISTKTVMAGLIISALAIPVLAQTPMPPSQPMPSSTPSAPAILSPSPVVTPVPTVRAGPEASSFFTAPRTSTSWRATEMMGANVLNRAREKIGDVSDLIIDSDGRVVAVVIGVGGFLGMGERNVAVTLATLQMSRDPAGKIALTSDLTKPALQAAPVFTHASR